MTSSSPFFFATIVLDTAAHATFVAVLAISAMLLIGSNNTIISVGRPAAENTVADVMVAVPGTPAVPSDTASDIIQSVMYCETE